MSEYQKASSVSKIKDTCSRRLKKRTKAEEGYFARESIYASRPNAARGFDLWLLRFEAKALAPNLGPNKLAGTKAAKVHQIGRAHV